MEMDVDFLSLEPVANARRATLNGRDYVVADVILLKEGVLHGSKGPLFYPFDEISAVPGVWNGIPLTANHPMRGDRPASAREPDMWAAHNLGFVFNDSIDPTTKSRKAEAWFDVEVCNRVDKRIIPAVINGKKINVSTGLFTVDRPVENAADAVHNGKAYTHIARNYRPDHLAVLMDDPGACSVRDGCGINVNAAAPSSPEVNVPATLSDLLTPKGFGMNREQLIGWLTTNCECWKGKTAVLNDDKSFTDDDLKKLKTNAEQATLAVNTLREVSAVIPGVTDKTTATELPALVKNAMTPKAPCPEPDADDKGKKGKEPAMNSAADITEDFILKNPDKFPTINAVVKSAKSVIDEKRIAIMQQLVANIADPTEKKAKLLKLRGKTLDQLNELLEFSGTTNVDQKSEEDKFLANFFGAQGGATNSAKPSYNRDDVLLPSLGFNSGEKAPEVEVVEV